MISIKNITKWYRVNESTGKKTFNHYEVNHVGGEYPLSFDESYSNQVAWKNEKWEKEFNTAKVSVNDSGLIKIILN